MIKKSFCTTKIYKDLQLQNKDLNYYFGITDKKFLHHVDNIYYAVFLKDDTTTKNDVPAEICGFISFLQSLKDRITEKSIDSVNFYNDLVLNRRVFKFYNLCLSIPNMFDIFVAGAVPNVNTPRIVIQLRSTGLWLNGDLQMVDWSFQMLKEVLDMYKIEIDHLQENRIDWCYHTNYIQNTEEYLNDKILAVNCCTSLGIGMDVFRKYKNKIVKDYVSFGNRSSNNIFWRCYNKVKEVIEMNYKGYFFEVWYKNNLISYYDKYCYEYAYKAKSFNSVDVGKLKFYLEFGSNIKIKEEINILLNAPSFTYDKARDFIQYYKLCPDTTSVINVEWQTMRKFYRSCDKLIDNLYIRNDCNDFTCRLYQILDNRNIFLDYLTSNTICFKKDNYENIENNLPKNISNNDRDKSIYLDWWFRLRHLKIDKLIDKKLIREYSKKLDLSKLINKCFADMATLNLYMGNTKYEEINFDDDLSCLLNAINDNSNCYDLIGLGGEVTRIDDDYNRKKEKKLRSIKALLEKQSPTQNNNGKSK
ncbi:MAG: hypothetical protein Q8900_12340 [Bacillota bacterium]|nr:hypothetical protein [Bacillota bacterium]